MIGAVWQEPEEDLEEPQTRKALNLLRESFNNTADFMVHLYDEHCLQQAAQICEKFFRT